VISNDELAAIAAALSVLETPAESSTPKLDSRWKLAAREPDFEVEDYRRVR